MKTVKSALLACALALVAFSSVTSAAPQNRKLDFTLYNKSGYVIVELYVSPSNDEEWGEDILGQDVIGDDESADITFTRGEASCNWDLKIVDDEEDEVTWTSLNLCQANEVTLRYQNGKPVAFIK